MDKLFGAYFFVPTSFAVELNRAQIRAQKELKGAQEEPKRSIKGRVGCSWRWMLFRAAQAQKSAWQNDKKPYIIIGSRKIWDD